MMLALPLYLDQCGEQDSADGQGHQGDEASPGVRLGPGEAESSAGKPIGWNSRRGGHSPEPKQERAQPPSG